MSEYMNIDGKRATIRRTLLAGASALALTAYISTSGIARAEDATRPEFWIELGGQFAQQENDAVLFSPPFLSASPFDAGSHLDLEKARSTLWDEGAKLAFQPEASDWVFSIELRYGKSARSDTRNGHPTTAKLNKYNYGNNGKSGYNAFQAFAAQNNESHMILDFQAGKDLGIGRFGSDSSSVVSLGIRIAQFNMHNHVSIQSQPTNADAYYRYDRFYAIFAAKRKFIGIGPSLSWDAAANIVGNPAGEGISLDWGINGVLLFGHQRTNIYPQITDFPFNQTKPPPYNRFTRDFPRYQHTTPISRSKSLVVPNLGGFAGVSWRYPNAKVSIGYRADFFFGAMDGGIDTAHRENVGFYGPFASVSVGLGG